MKPRRSTPRRRAAPRWTAAEWDYGNGLLLVRSAGMCELCDDPLGGDVQRHHRKRRRDGGDRLANLVLLHSDCHRKITENPNWANMNGFIVWVEQDPLVVPVFWRLRGLVLLDDEGGKRFVDGIDPVT